MNWYALIRPFIATALLRAAPQDLPASGLLLGLSALAATLAGVLSYMLVYEVRIAFVATVTELAVLAALACGALFAQRLAGRIPQTLTALAGTTAVMTFVTLPVQSWVFAARDAGAVTGAHGLAVIALTGWALAVTGHIMRHAMSLPMWAGLAFALANLWVVLQVMGAVMHALGQA